MAKISKKRIAQALKDLEAANGNRKTRVLRPDQVTNFFDLVELLYKESSHKKYFRGVEGNLLAIYQNKPKSYSYKAYMTTLYVKIEKNKPPIIRVQEEYWDYISVAKARGPVVIWD